jgi:hypothetical protein
MAETYDQAYAECVAARKAEHDGYALYLHRLVQRGVMKRREALAVIEVHAGETLMSQNQE